MQPLGVFLRSRNMCLMPFEFEAATSLATVVRTNWAGESCCASVAGELLISPANMTASDRSATIREIFFMHTALSTLKFNNLGSKCCPTGVLVVQKQLSALARRSLPCV